MSSVFRLLSLPTVLVSSIVSFADQCSWSAFCACSRASSAIARLPTSSPAHIFLFNSYTLPAFPPSFLGLRSRTMTTVLNRNRVISLASMSSLRKLICYIDVEGLAALPTLSFLCELTIHDIRGSFLSNPSWLLVPELQSSLRLLTLPERLTVSLDPLRSHDLHTLVLGRLLLPAQSPNPFASFPLLQRLEVTLLVNAALPYLPTTLTHLSLRIELPSSRWATSKPILLQDRTMLLETLPLMPSLVAFAFTNATSQSISFAPLRRFTSLRTLHACVLAICPAFSVDWVSDLTALASLAELKLSGFLPIVSLRPLFSLKLDINSLDLFDSPSPYCVAACKMADPDVVYPSLPSLSLR